MEKTINLFPAMQLQLQKMMGQGLFNPAANVIPRFFGQNSMNLASYGHDVNPAEMVQAEAKLIDFRGEKIAGFEINGVLMICLPQAYDLFLKSMVGGLHTVYTKLKRLEILPLVCNVEQVRALRSLGAIQPGVNRCKLISCDDFDALFEDCTNASSRPGRPPKRSPVPFSPTSGEIFPSVAPVLKRPKIEEKQNLIMNDLMNPMIPFMQLQNPLWMSQMISANQNEANMFMKQFSDTFNHTELVKQEPTTSPPVNGVGVSCSSSEIKDDVRDCNGIDKAIDNEAINLTKRQPVDQVDDHNLNECSSDVDKQELNDNDQFDDQFNEEDQSSDSEEIKKDDDDDISGQFDNCGDPIETVLRNVQDMIEIAVVSSKTQRDQQQKEKWELSKQKDEINRKCQTLEQTVSSLSQQLMIMTRKLKLSQRRRIRTEKQLTILRDQFIQSEWIPETESANQVISVDVPKYVNSIPTTVPTYAIDADGVKS